MPDFIDKILAYGFFKFDMDMSGKPGVHNGFEITKSQEKRMGHLLKKENRRRIKAMAKYQKEQERKFPKETIGPTYENNGHVFCNGCNDWLEYCHCWVFNGGDPPE